MKFGALILGLLLSWQFVEAKAILVSDIDDTVKNTHVLDHSDAFWNALSTKNLISGMNDAYQLLKRQYDQTHQELDIYYVSNAPPLVYGSKHKEFMAEHGFPVVGEGSFFFRSDLKDEAHKVNSIKSILSRSIDQEHQSIDSIIFVGDNGEKDVLVYQEASAFIRQNYPNIKVSTYIRMGYWTNSSEDAGRATLENQVGYATALDLVLNWTADGILDGSAVSTSNTQNSSDSLTSFINSFSASLEKEIDPNTGKVKQDRKSGVLIFPKWVDCRDVVFNADLLISVPADAIETAGKALQKVAERCSEPGSESRD